MAERYGLSFEEADTLYSIAMDKPESDEQLREKTLQQYLKRKLLIWKREEWRMMRGGEDEDEEDEEEEDEEDNASDDGEHADEDDENEDNEKEDGEYEVEKEYEYVAKAENEEYENESDGEYESEEDEICNENVDDVENFDGTLDLPSGKGTKGPVTGSNCSMEHGRDSSQVSKLFGNVLKVYSNKRKSDAEINGPDPKKNSLGFGAYRDDQGKPFVLPSVKEVERQVIAANFDKEYADITDLSELTKLFAKLSLGESSKVVNNKRKLTTQSISGTCALRIGSEILPEYAESKDIYEPTPIKGNYVPVSEFSGVDEKQYRYYDKSTCGFDEGGALAVFAQIREGSHHHDIAKKRKMFVFFDMAHEEGFASRYVDNDAIAVRNFIEQGHNVILSESSAKNMRLYGERVGAISVATSDVNKTARIASQVEILIRPLYINPPVHGGLIASRILSDPFPNKQWLGKVKLLADRIITMRTQLKNLVVKERSTCNWEKISIRFGMFCFTGINEQQVEKLIKEHSVYLTKDGRISVGGISSNNVAYLAHALHHVTK